MARIVFLGTGPKKVTKKVKEITQRFCNLADALVGFSDSHAAEDVTDAGEGFGGFGVGGFDFLHGSL